MLRSYRQPCCTSLLRANRQLYEEFVTAWYGAVPYRIYVDESEICITFCGVPYDHHLPLPSTLFFVRDLRIRHGAAWTPEENINIARPSSIEKLIHHLTSGSTLLHSCQVSCFFGQENASHDLWYLFRHLDEHSKAGHSHIATLVKRNFGPLGFLSRLNGVNRVFNFPVPNTRNLQYNHSYHFFGSYSRQKHILEWLCNWINRYLKTLE